MTVSATEGSDQGREGVLTPTGHWNAVPTLPTQSWRGAPQCPARRPHGRCQLSARGSILTSEQLATKSGSHDPLRLDKSLQPLTDLRKVLYLGLQYRYKGYKSGQPNEETPRSGEGLKHRASVPTPTRPTELARSTLAACQCAHYLGGSSSLVSRVFFLTL